MPAVTPEFARVPAAVTLPDPSKLVDHVRSPVTEMVRAVSSLLAVAAFPPNCVAAASSLLASAATASFLA